jgi:hypothetical protein
MIILQQARGLLSSNDQLALDLPLAETKSITARVGATPVFTRASTATFIGSDGLIQSAAVNEPRFEHDPLTGVCGGLLLEQSRTNLVFPSATLTTQTRTVTAVAHTLSFYGTGTVVLSGTHVATVTGTGAFPTRTILTFTPTAGSLILTVTGTVTEAQLEAGATATSYIPTTAGTAVRSQDLCTITGAAFTGMYNQTEGSIFSAVTAVGATTTANSAVYGIHAPTRSNGGVSAEFTSTLFRSSVHSTGFINQALFQTTASRNVLVKNAVAFRTDDFANSCNGNIATDTSGTLPAIMDRFVIGATGNTGGPQIGNNIISSIKYYRKRLPNAKLQALTI